MHLKCNSNVCVLTHVLLGYSVIRARLGEGGADSASCLSSEALVVEGRIKRDSKNLNKVNRLGTKLLGK